MAEERFLSVHLPSWVGLAQPCEVPYADDSGEEEEEEIVLE